MCCRVHSFMRCIRMRTAAIGFAICGLIAATVFLVIEALELMDERYYNIRKTGLAGVTVGMKMFLMFEIGLNSFNIFCHLLLLLGIACKLKSMLIVWLVRSALSIGVLGIYYLGFNYVHLDNSTEFSLLILLGTTLVMALQFYCFVVVYSLFVEMREDEHSIEEKTTETDKFWC